MGLFTTLTKVLAVTELLKMGNSAPIPLLKDQAFEGNRVIKWNDPTSEEMARACKVTYTQSPEEITHENCNVEQFPAGAGFPSYTLYSDPGNQCRLRVDHDPIPPLSDDKSEAKRYVLGLKTLHVPADNAADCTGLIADLKMPRGLVVTAYVTQKAPRKVVVNDDGSTNYAKTVQSERKDAALQR